jgi:lysozyme family protein
MFAGCTLKPGKLTAIQATAATIARNRPTYESVGRPLDIPWFVIGCVHAMETSLNFKEHLYNGDPLTARTVHVPAGQPTTGEPPFTWAQSALGALVYQGWNRWQDWSVAGCLYKFEGYNGFGYRKSTINIPSPYLWSFSTYYNKGKFDKDGHYDANLVSQQCGAAVILKQLSEAGAIVLTAPPAVSEQDLLAAITELGAQVKFAPTVNSATAAKLQEALGAYLHQRLAVDGYAGQQTSDLYKQVAGSYLAGDPRNGGTGTT